MLVFFNLILSKAFFSANSICCNFSPDFGFSRKDINNGCVTWSSPYSKARPWVQKKYLQCMQKAYPTEEIFIQNFDALDALTISDLNREYLSK